MASIRGIAIGVAILLVASIGSYGVYTIFFAPQNELFLATTTSVDNTGLLDLLKEEFEAQSDVTLTWIAVGSGAAIQLARDGEVDALIVHAPNLELELIVDGYVKSNTTLWYNYFIIIGPSNDPANIASATTATEAFEMIYEAGEIGDATFYSRGDGSGTHEKEKSIWENSKYNPNPLTHHWYIETGVGMSPTITTADEDDLAYTMTDLGTFASLSGSATPPAMIELYAEDEFLYNPYSFHIINEDKTNTDLNTEYAEEFLEFLELPSTIDLVRNLQVGGVQLFTPIGE